MNIHTVYRAVKGTVREFLKDSCTLRATSLAYTTLLALVPLSATVFSISTAFGAFSSMEEQIKDFFINQILPTRQEEILAAFQRFVENASTLGIVGFTIFAITSVSLLNGINMNFNAVWASSPRKGFLGFFTTYTSVIIFGTIFLGASFTLTSAVRQILSGLTEIIWLFRIALKIAPSLFIFFLFLLMITLIPTGPVLRKSAVIGALVGTVLWEVAKIALFRGTNYVIRSSIIYGSIATIPIFLFWLYLVWLIIFIALETAYVHQHRLPETGKHSGRLDHISVSASLSLQIYLLCAGRFLKGKGPVDADELSLELSLDQNTFHRLIKPLVRDSLLHSGKNEGPVLLPGKDLSAVTLEMLIRTVFSYHNGAVPDEAVHPLVEEVLKAGSSSLRDTSVLEYLSSENGDD
jgi:membrane protein